jgi:hypothetical protein
MTSCQGPALDRHTLAAARFLAVKPGRVHNAYLFQMPDNSVALQIRIFANFLLMAIIVALGRYAIHALLLLYALTEAEIHIIEGKKP